MRELCQAGATEAAGEGGSVGTPGGGMGPWPRPGPSSSVNYGGSSALLITQVRRRCPSEERCRVSIFRNCELGGRAPMQSGR